MTRLVIAIAVTLTACGPEPRHVQRAAADPTSEAWYPQTTTQLAALAGQAEAAYQHGQPDQASALIEKAEPLMTRVLAVPRPSLAAAEAASRVDELYGRMLLGNRHYGWARLQFQKNLARWKHWEPQTTETIRLRQQAEASLAECDRHLP